MATPLGPQRPVGKGRRALVVDDDPQIRRLFDLILTNAGFQVEVAEGGRAALQKLKESCHDVVTLDLAMSDMSGMAVIECVRELPYMPPIVVVSGAAEVVEGRRKFARPVVAFIAKPLRPSELVAACEEALELDPSSRTPSRRR